MLNDLTGDNEIKWALGPQSRWGRLRHVGDKGSEPCGAHPLDALLLVVDSDARSGDGPDLAMQPGGIVHRLAAVIDTSDIEDLLALAHIENYIHAGPTVNGPRGG
jgi:hypothetical protein